ncbi:phage tail tape measure protein [Candidatus Dependentiae bacterium]|nr:MAG: phage tail tape measure protein [Candidatus Dependentiae bacterium]
MNELGLGVVFDAKDLATGTMQKVSKGLLDITGASSEAGEAIKKHFAAFSTGMAMFGAGASMLGGAFALANVSGKFSEQVAIVGAVAGASASELKDLEKAAIDAGVATQFSPNEAIVGLGDLTQSGYSATESIELLRPVLDLAAGSLGKLSPSGAAGLASQTLKAFSLSSDQAGVTVDKLLQSVNAFAISAEELPLALATVTRGSIALNQNLDESLIAFGMVKDIIPGVERSSTAVATAMERMVTPDTQRALKSIGVAAVDSNGKFRSFLDIIVDLQKALGGMNEAKKAAFLQKTFGTEALGGLNAILTQLENGVKAAGMKTGAEAVEHLRNSMANAAGTAANFRDAMLGTYEGQKKLVAGSLETLSIVVGKPFEEALKPAVTAFLDAINAVLAVVQSMPTGMKNFIAQVVVGVGAILTLVGGVLAGKAALALMAAGLEAIGVTVAGVVSAIAPAIGIILVLGAVIAAFKIAVEKDIGGIGTFFSDAYDVIALTFGAIGQLISDGGFSGEILNELDAGNEGIENFAVNVYLVINRVIEFFEQLGSGFSSAIEEAGPTFEAFKNSIMGIVDLFEGLFTDIDPGQAVGAFNSVGAAGDKVGRILARVATAVINIVTVVLDVVGGIGSTALGPIGDLLGVIWDSLGEVIGAIGEVVSELGIFDNAVDGTESGWVGLGKSIGNIVASAADLIKSLIRTVKDALKGAINVIGGIIEMFTGNFDQGLKRVLSGLIGIIGSIVFGAMDLVATASDILFGTEFSNKVNEWRKGLDETLYSGLKTKPEDIVPSKGSEKDALSGASRPDVLSFYQMPEQPQQEAQAFDPLAFYAMPPAPAAAMESTSQQSLDVAGLNATLADIKQAKSGPINLEGNISVDGEVLGRMALKGARSAAADGQQPVSLMSGG